jgi:hypothetical protein
MQNTIRGVSKPRSARKRRNETVSDARAAARPKRRDLSDIAGTWKNDKGFDSALAAQDEAFGTC